MPISDTTTTPSAQNAATGGAGNDFYFIDGDTVFRTNESQIASGLFLFSEPGTETVMLRSDAGFSSTIGNAAAIVVIFDVDEETARAMTEPEVEDAAVLDEAAMARKREIDRTQQQIEHYSKKLGPNTNVVRVLENKLACLYGVDGAKSGMWDRFMLGAYVSFDELGSAIVDVGSWVVETDMYLLTGEFGKYAENCWKGVKTIGNAAKGAYDLIAGDEPFQMTDRFRTGNIAETVGSFVPDVLIGAATTPAGGTAAKATTTGAKAAAGTAVRATGEAIVSRARMAAAGLACFPCTPKPVSLVTGEKIFSDVDFVFGRSIPLTIGRAYSSASPVFGPLGRDRLSALDEFIQPLANGMVMYHSGCGAEAEFARPAPLPGAASKNAAFPDWSLEAGPDRTLFLTATGVVKTFRRQQNRLWILDKIEDRTGNRILFHRDQRGKLVRVDHSDGPSLVFENDPHSGRRRAVLLKAPDGTTRPMVRYDYDDHGNMTAVHSPYGRPQRYAYDDRNRVIAWADDTFSRRAIYDDHDRVTEVVSDVGSAHYYLAYDPDNKRTRTFNHDAPERWWEIEYDHNQAVLVSRKPTGETRYVRDDLGRVLEEADGEGNAVSYLYDANGQIKTVTDPEGRRSRYVMRTDGRPLAIIDPAGNKTAFEYDAFDNLTALIDPAGGRTALRYDDRGRPVRITRADGFYQERRYTATGLLSALRDFDGSETQFAYDAFDRLIAVQLPDGAVTRYAYDEDPGTDFTSPSRIIRADGAVISRRTAGNRLTLAVTEAEGRKVIYRYGEDDRLLEIADAAGGTVRIDYDGAGETTAVINQQGLRWTFERDAGGRIVRETDFTGQTFAYAYDKADRLIETRYSDGARLTFAYDRSGLLIREAMFEPGADTPADIATFDYDACGLLKTARNGAATIAFERDALGRIVTETRNGRKIVNTYSCCGDRVSRQIGGRLVDAVYDPMGALTHLTIDGHRPLDLTRDIMGRELRRRSAAGFKLDQTWDPLGRLAKQTAGFAIETLGTGLEAARKAQQLGIRPQAAASQVSRTFSWNKAFEPLKVADGRWGDTVYAYDALGLLVDAAFGDGQRERFTFDIGRHPVGSGGDTPRTGIEALMARAASGDATAQTFNAWATTADGRIQQARGENGERVALTYDARGRVTERLVERKGFRTRTWRYGWDARDRLIRCETPDGQNWRYGYDAFGRRAFKMHEDAWLKLTRKARAKATAADIPTEPDRGAFYTVDFAPRPMASDKTGSKIVGTVYIWDGAVMAEEAPLDADGNVDFDNAIRWHYEPESVVPLARQNPDGTLWYVVADHLGTPREMFTETGQLVWAAEYRTWGAIRRLWRKPPTANDDALGSLGKPGPTTSPPGTGGIGVYTTGIGLGGSRGGVSGNLALADTAEWYEATTLCPIRFQGQWEDAETGLYYNRFRYYDPLIGQYLSPDPIGLAGGLRTHGYVDNPNAWVDPLGLAKVCCAIPFKPGKPHDLVNVLKEFDSQLYRIGNETFLLDKSGMGHILERHHPLYWNGSVKRAQTFFSPAMTVSDVKTAVGGVLLQNRETLIHGGTYGAYQIEGIYNGTIYRLGINKGNIGQFYPIPLK